MPTPGKNPFRKIDRETFLAFRQNPEQLQAHLDGLLAAVHDRMMAPFREEPVYNYQTFEKKPAMDLTHLVKMPLSVPDISINAQKKGAAKAPAKENDVAQKQQSVLREPVYSEPRGVYITKSGGGDLQKGVLNEDLQNQPIHPAVPDRVPEAVGHLAENIPGIQPKKQIETTEPSKKEADAELVKQRFEARQKQLEDLLKNKGNLT